MSISKMTDESARAALDEHTKLTPPAPEALPKPAPRAAKALPRLAAPAPTRSWWPTLLTLCVAGAAVYFAWPWLPWLIALTSPGGKAGPAVAKPARTVPVVTAAVRQADMDLYLNGLGTVTAFNTVTIRSRVEGELVRVAFTEGQMVEKGDLLAEIDPRPFEVQLAHAQGQLTKDQAAFKAAKLTLGRYNDLLTTRSVRPQQIDEQIALVDQSEGAIQADNAQIDNAKLQLTYCKIIAPVSGRIGLRLVDPGNIVRANDPSGMAVVTQLQPIALVFTIPQDEISRVQEKLGEGRTLAVDAYDRDFKRKLAAGKLLAIDNQVDSMTGTVRLKAVFENEDNMLFPNQFVNARLLVDVKRDATIAPAAAVQRGPDSTFVYVVQSDETVELRKVATGPVEGDQVSIESGLSAGEVVVTDGVDKLQPGAKVVLRERNSPSGETALNDAARGPDGGRQAEPQAEAKPRR